MNKLSVLIPTYNRADFLYYTLESLAKQTFKDFIVLIWDDGSTDNTKKIVNQFSDKLNIIYTKTEENNGVGYCRNRLLELVDTEYFAFQDSDDLAQPDRFEKQLSQLENTKSDVCFTFAYFFRHPNKNRRWEYKIDVSKYNSRDGLFRNMLFATGMFRSELTKYKFDSRLKKKEDVVWLSKLIKNNITFTCVNEPLYYIRQHSGRLTTNTNENTSIR